MKHFFPVHIFLILFSLYVNAQDTIVLNDGKKILAKHIHIRKKIYYHDYPSHLKDSMEKSGVNYVIHASGWKIPIIPLPWHSPIIISPGIGVSAMMVKFHDYIKDTGANIISFSPVYSINIDYSLYRKYSLGIGVAWQSMKINPYVYNNLPYYTGGPDETAVENLTRLNAGARFLYHIRNDDEKDFYVGFRTGLSFWTDHSNPPGFNSEGGLGTKPSIQGIIGLRKDITDYLGIYLEGAVGSPYFANTGIYLKMNTTKKDRH